MPQALDPTTQHFIDRMVQAMKDFRETVLHAWPEGDPRHADAVAFAKGVEKILGERGIVLPPTPSPQSAKEPTP